jgi:hypothetical protein
VGQVEESIARYLHQLDIADRQEPSEALKTKTSRLKEKSRSWQRCGPSRPQIGARSAAEPLRTAEIPIRSAFSGKSLTGHRIGCPRLSAHVFLHDQGRVGM